MMLHTKHTTIQYSCFGSDCDCDADDKDVSIM